MDSSEVEECFITFRGKCKGVGLKKRGKDDNHVCFVILTEDDEHWFVSQGTTSSYWLPELIQCLESANSWIKNYCIKDPSGYGYQFDESLL